MCRITVYVNMLAKISYAMPSEQFIYFLNKKLYFLSGSGKPKS